MPTLPQLFLQGVPNNQAMQLPHYCNSSRLARDTLVLGPSAALNRDPTPITSVLYYLVSLYSYYRKSWAGNLLMWSDLTLGPPLRSNDYSQC